jgi:nitrogenase molybdenum-iron protein alpha chain
VFATCPVGLIGDDIHTVAARMKKKLGDCNVYAFSCEGYKGVSQSAGHHIANNQVFRHIVGENDEQKPGKFKINLLGANAASPASRPFLAIRPMTSSPPPIPPT